MPPDFTGLSLPCVGVLSKVRRSCFPSSAVLMAPLVTAFPLPAVGTSSNSPNAPWLIELSALMMASRTSSPLEASSISRIYELMSANVNHLSISFTCLSHWSIVKASIIIPSDTDRFLTPFDICILSWDEMLSHSSSCFKK